MRSLLQRDNRVGHRTVADEVVSGSCDLPLEDDDDDWNHPPRLHHILIQGNLARRLFGSRLMTKRCRGIVCCHIPGS